MKLKRSAVAALAVAGFGLLGTSVQGIASVDDDLARATEQLRQSERMVVKKDGSLCPRKPRRTSAAISLQS